ncbi:MAG TPA: putative 2OG-Fe(II) oxygenase [Acetobacteraceae bacterium]|nr:putative 2OG-Fe(II) oxygenase [Acetobacteraceae bacterium]
MDNSCLPAIENHLVFPTRLMTIRFSDVATMNAALLAIYDNHDEYQSPEYLETSNSTNMLRWCETVPAVARLRDLFLFGLNHWLSAEGIVGDYTAEMLMFPVYSLPNQFVPAHNHLAHVSAVYYVRTDDFSDRDMVEYGGTAEYFRSDGGILQLHDPRFNALLMDLTKKDSVKIFPRPGLMVIMPGYLWHSGTPNYAAFNRLAVVGDFILHERKSPARQSYCFEVAATGNPPAPR